jgi:serine/threonine protein phosphatase PrpC
VRPEVTSFRLRDGDRVMLCSDGLWSAIDDDDLASIVAGSEELEAVCASLIEAAIERGSDDNVSVIVVRVGSAAPIRNSSGIRENGRINGGLMRTLTSLMKSPSANH